MAPWWMPFARRGSTGAAPMPDPKRAADESPSPLASWQKKAWGYYETLGEIHYGGGFYARMLAGVEIVAQERDSTGEWVECTRDTFRSQLERLENAKGGMSALQATYGKLMFVQGESQLARTLIANPVGLTGQPALIDGKAYSERWEMLSSQELTYKRGSGGAPGEYTRVRRPGSQPEKIPETDPDDPQPGSMTAWRFFHPDPEFSSMADSSMRAVLDDCEELLLLKRAIRNTARNRGAGNGVLVLPASMGGNEIDMGDGTKVPKNAMEIYNALTAPIANEQAASAVSPIILFAPPGVTNSEAFHIDLRGAALYKETGLRDECIRRIAIGLDMPPEALLGTAGVNHWTAWQIDEAAWKNHGAPVTRELCEYLTGVLFAPLALDEGLDPSDFRVWYDPTSVVEDPDRGRAAMEAYDRITISGEAYRRETGWEEADAPDDAEFEKRLRAQTKAPSGAGNPSKGEPRQGQAAVSPERLIGLAEACVLRCRELAGSRLRTKVNGNGTPANLRVRIKSAHNSDVACRLGSDVECDPDALVAGAGSVFLSGMTKLGLDPSLAETLVRRVEEHAARTLLLDDPGDLPDEVLAICALASRRI